MDTQQVIAPPCAPPSFPDSSGTRSDVTPTSGVLHVNVRHVSGFTVIGNHLAQHHELSLVAIGLAAHIQSLPAGAKVGIKVLTDRFPESEARITAALHELEAGGYLRRGRVRLPSGRVVTRTVSYNQPGAAASTTTARQPRPQPRRSTPPTAPTAPPPREATPPAAPPPPAPVHVPPPTAPRTPPRPLPQPHAPTEELYRAASALLADLRRHVPQLGLTRGDITTLAPGIATWLERDTHPDTIRHALTSDLPAPVKHPAKLLRHRITTLLPPPLPGTADLTPPRRRTVVIPLQNCHTCERAFRAPHPGHCRDCRTEHPAVTHSAA
ncbi:helix-turn-helix domain-containing protein [Streptomyces sp. NPDC059814]|uniref:helix-turn-helix domain-containing protein n=1 Tax=Streptomyces sp. NPDC059814 TaxID=3346959 RepID=UPI003665C004